MDREDRQLNAAFKGRYRRFYTLASSQTGYRYSRVNHQPPQIPFRIRPQTSATNDENTICINNVLPDDLLVEVLIKLPTTIIDQSCSVCKKWIDIIHSMAFVKKFRDSSPRKPFYLMLTHPDETYGHIYDLELKKWSSLEVPSNETLHSATASSSGGLICFMPEYGSKEVYVYNPITGPFKRLPDSPGAQPSDYSALSISEGRTPNSYNVTMIRSFHGDSHLDWKIWIEEYDSETQKWESLSELKLPGRRGGSDCVECEGVLYFVVYITSSTQDVNPAAICAYNKNSGSLDMDLIELPCRLTCIRLMKMKGKVVMVGGVKKQRRSTMKAIRVWVLVGRRWAEVARMPTKILREFEDMDEVFLSSGFNDTVYIQSYGERKLLMFDMGLRMWRWAKRAPQVRQCGIQLLSGICFEPRFDMVP